MTYLFHPALTLLFLLGWALLALKLWALVDCAIRPTPAFPAHGKLTKPVWLAILAAAVLLGGGLGLLGIAATVAAIVYLVDVRPAVSGKAP